MIKVGLTGGTGFIGSHIKNNLNLYKHKYDISIIKRDHFKDREKINLFVSRCDIISHLAAINRSSNSKNLYKTNLELVKVLTS